MTPLELDERLKYLLKKGWVIKEIINGEVWYNITETGKMALEVGESN